MEKDLEPYLVGSTIDYRKSWLGGGFQIRASGVSC